MPLDASESAPSSAPELDELGLHAAARGDRRAFRRLVECYEGRVRALLTRMMVGRSRDLVDDLTQECFLRVFRALPGFDPRGRAKLSTWILTIATRLAIDELRRRRPQPDARVEETAAQGVGDADLALRRARLRRALVGAVASLSPDHRAVFVLHAFHGLAYAEIALALELELGTVKSRMGRARARMREALREEEMRDDV